MNLWIRSQDKKNLFKVDEIKIEREYIDFQDKEIFHINTAYDELGEYKTEKRALEVLNEIEERICLLQTIELATGNQTMMKAYQIAMGDDKIKGIGYPYQMPIE